MRHDAQQALISQFTSRRPAENNHTAVEDLLARGYTIDPLVASLLADAHWLKTDRLVHTGISYIV